MGTTNGQNSALLPVLRPLLRRLNAVIWLERSLPTVSVLAGVWATALLLLKLFFPAWLSFGYASVALIPFGLLYGYWQARRREAFFAPRHGAELADSLFRNDGQVSAYFEVPELYPRLDAAAFAQQLRGTLQTRAPRLRPTYFLRRLTPAFVYVVAVLVIPVRPVLERARVQTEATQTLIEPIVERLEENRDILPEERLQDLLADAAKLEESQEGLTREKWEAVEHLEQQLQDALDQSRQTTTNVAQSLRDLTSGPDFQDNPLSAAQSPEFNTGLQQLKDMLNLSTGDLPPGLLEQLQAAAEQMDCMCQGGADMSGVDREAMLQQIAQLQGQLDSLLEQMREESDEGNAGRGGIDRGRGDAPLVFGEPEQLTDAQVEQDRLRNQYLTPEDLVDLGITLLEPEPDPGKFSPGTLQSFEQVRGQAVSRTRISPSQREVVGKFFSGE